ncbi:MAG: CPBP family intramembrane metalloprotease [Ruminiclostridium sp.]|nr:CPBP family intramembrane metalloprotease [Ruminiclostridium sp.]
MDGERGSLKSLVSRYAAMLFLEPVNYLLGGYLILSLVYAVAGAFFGSAAADRKTDIGFTVSMVANALISYGIPIAAAALLFRGHIRELGKLPESGDYKRFPLDIVVLYIAGLFFATCGSLLTGCISDLLNALYGVPKPEMAFSGSMPTSVYTFSVMTVNTLIVAPLCEELLYRHYLLKPLQKYSDTAAVIVSAMLFSLSHFNFDQFLYTFFFGIFLGIIAVRSGSVLPAVICHVINNLTALLQSYLPETFGDAGIDEFFRTLSRFVTNAALIVFYVGAGAAVLAVVMKTFRLKNRSELPVRTQFAVIFGSPLLLLGAAACLGLTVWLLFAV